MLKIIFLGLFLSLLALFLPFNGKKLPAYAAGTCGTPPPAALPRAQGLVTAPSLGDTSNFYVDSSGRCIIDLNTAFVPYKIPAYADLKSLYYTQQSTATKSPIDTSSTSIPSVSDNTVYNYTNAAGVTIGSSSSNFTYNGTSVVFVDNDLNINGNIVGDNSSGLVLMSGGNINIASTVTRIDAVLITEGTIYTAGSGCRSSSVSTSQLVINGSFISLNPDHPINFCRTLSDNRVAAEQINNEPKYLVLLREIIYQNLQKWSEITK